MDYPTMSHSTSTIIRPATPADRDAVPLLYSSGPYVFDYVFTTANKSALSFLEHVFIKEGNLFSYQNTFVAELDGNIMGAALFCSGKNYDQGGAKLGNEILRKYWFSAISVIVRANKLSRVIPRPDDDVEYLNNLGVAEQARGRGIGLKLLEFGYQLAKANNKRALSLDVAHSNPRAQALYERFGMKVISSEEGIKGTKVPGSNRMEREL